MTRMSEMHAEGERDRETEAASSSSTPPSAKRTIVIDVDGKLAERLGVTARWQGVSEEDLLAEAIEQHPKHSEQRSLTVQVSEAAAARLAAAAATIGMSEEELIAEAIDTYYPREKAARIWPMLGFYGLVLVLPLVLMFISPRIGRPASAVDWTLFASAMLVCCAGAGVLVTTVIYAEWVVIKYGIAGLVFAAGCGAVAVLSVFAYVYWLLGSLRPASFNLPLSRVDAVLLHFGHVHVDRHGPLRCQFVASRIACLLSGGARLGLRGRACSFARNARRGRVQKSLQWPDRRSRRVFTLGAEGQLQCHNPAIAARAQLRHRQPEQ